MLDIIGNFLLGLVVAIAGCMVLLGLIILALKLGRNKPLIIDPRKHAGSPSFRLLGFYLVIMAFALGLVVATVVWDFISRNRFGRTTVTYLDYARNLTALLIVAVWSWFNWRGKKIKLG